MCGGRIASVDNGVIVLDERHALPDRLATLLERLDELVRAHRPTSAAVEGVFQHRNARSALVLGHARGVALAVLARGRLSVAEYTPQQVKKSVTGTGRADKSQVQQVVARRLGLPEPPQADAADAVAVAICHAQHLAFPLPDGVPALPTPARGRRSAKSALAALVAAQHGVSPPPRGRGVPGADRPPRPSGAPRSP